MLCPPHPGNLQRHRTRAAALLFPALLSFSVRSHAQSTSPANNPASVPSGALAPLPAPPPPKPVPPRAVSAKQLREADDAYLEGAKQIEHKNIPAAQRSFERAVQLDPTNRDYSLALMVTRESHLNELVQSAAKARLLGDTLRADALLAEARELDPTNPVVLQHFDPGAVPQKPAAAPYIGDTLDGPVEFTPTAGTHDFHLHGDPQTVTRTIYSTFGIAVVFDPSVSAGSPITLDMDNVNFADATRILASVARIFAVPVQPLTALIAKDTQENREALSPLVEETIYLPGLTQDQMTELANVARNIFDVKQVTASPTGGFMLLRGDENVLAQVNATYADMLDGGSEVLFDVNLYELDRTTSRDIGATLPSSAGVFSIAAEAQSIVNSNQSLINEAISAGLLVLSGNSVHQLEQEVGFLVASGQVTATQFTGLLGYFGGGIGLAGAYLGSNSQFQLLLNSSDVRTLDAVQIRSGNHQPVNFRAGSRYPVVTGTYSSGVSSSLASSLAGITVNGVSAASLASQYLGSSSSVSVPQFQYEDLGITLKLTPQILRSSQVQLALDLKIEALAGGTINSIPILANRVLTSTITVPEGQTVMLATVVTSNEVKSLDGLPGLSELPGFQGTDQDREHDSTELLLTITPHIVRTGSLHVASRRLAAIRTGISQ